MPTVGRMLASERVRQRLDLEDIARITKINVRSLQSIENDDFEQLPGMVFARNFVRQYAQCLQLDDAAAVAQFDREQSTAPSESPTPPRDTAHIYIPPLKGSSFGRIFDSNTISAFVSFVLTLAVCAGAAAAFQYWRNHNVARAAAHSVTAPAPAAAKPASVKPSAVQPAPEKPPSAPTTQSVLPIPASSSPPTPAHSPVSAQLDSPLVAVSGAKIHVALSASQPCWTRVTADGKMLFSGLLAAGDSRNINAAQNVEIRAGNAGGLSIQLNGTAVPPIGPEGQVRTVVITPAGAQVRTPIPDPDFR